MEDKITKKVDLNFVFILTLVYFFVELIGGIYYNSLALVTDASFMAINIAGQLLTIFAEKISKKPPDEHNTFGYLRIKVISALFNGILVGFVIFYIFIEAYKRILNPEPIYTEKVLIIAVLGLIVNGIGIYKIYKYTNDINIKGAFLHILTDTLGSIGVIISAILIEYTKLYFIDAVASILISLLVAYPTYFLLKDSIHILMEGNPRDIKQEDIKNFLLSNFNYIKNIKDIRIWALTPDIVIAVFRVRTKNKYYSRENIKKIKEELKNKFGFYDVYVEIYEEGKK